MLLFAQNESWKFFLEIQQKSRKRKFASIKINIEIKTKKLNSIKGKKKDLRGGVGKYTSKT